MTGADVVGYAVGYVVVCVVVWVVCFFAGYGLAGYLTDRSQR